MDSLIATPQANSKYEVAFLVGLLLIISTIFLISMGASYIKESYSTHMLTSNSDI